MTAKKKTANRKYKDSLFRNMFNYKKRLLELYNAIESTDYKDPEAIEINTLEDVFSIGMKNDISFRIYDRLVLIEHQSTINENMPLRMSMYMHQLWEKIIQESQKSKYQKQSVEIPDPLLIVLYNGKEDYPKEKTLYLSSLFINKNLKKKIVDVEVKVININKGCNPELEHKCKTLFAYITCIDKIREYEKEHTLDKSIELAVKYCIDNDLCKEYFKKKRSEVINMLTGEFNLEEYKEVLLWEGKEEGKKEGEKKGQDYVLKLMEQGLSADEIRKKLKKTSRKNGK